MFTRVHTRIHLLRGALLRTIAHAFYLLENPYYAHEITWENGHYLLNDSLGNLGVITFHQHGVVGAFCNQESKRHPALTPPVKPGKKRKKTPYPQRGEEYDHTYYITHMPQSLQAVANEHTLTFLLDDLRGRVVPLITSVFWSDEDGLLTSFESWDHCMEHGADMIDVELMDYDTALEMVKEKYELSSRKMKLLTTLYEQRINPANRSIRLRADERDILFTDGAEGIMEAAALLKSIGIALH